MSAPSKLPPRLLLGLVLMVVLDTFLQVLWKVAVNDLPKVEQSWLSFVAGIASNPLFMFVVLLMGLQFFNWLVILGHADVSYAYPFTALSYVSVFVLSIVYLNQEADPVQALGVVFVLAGVWFIGKTDHKTKTPENAP